MRRISFGARTYNASIGRFDGVDELGDHLEQLAISLYAFSNNNPVNMKDDDGRLPTFIIGALVGASVDYGFQVIGNLAGGKSLGKSLVDVDYKSIGISAGAGALSSGLSAFGGKATQFAVSTGIDATESVLKQANESGKVTLAQTASDVVSNKVAGHVTRKAGNLVDTKILSREASRTARISAKDPSSSGRALKAETAKAALTKAEAIKTVVETTASGVTGNIIQNTSNASRAQSVGNRSHSTPASTAQSDATKVYKPLITERQQ